MDKKFVVVTGLIRDAQVLHIPEDLIDKVDELDETTLGSMVSALCIDDFQDVPDGFDDCKYCDLICGEYYLGIVEAASEEEALGKASMEFKYPKKLLTLHEA